MSIEPVAGSSIDHVDVGWNPFWPIFHDLEGNEEEHEKHEREITQSTKSDHTYAKSTYT